MKKEKINNIKGFKHFILLSIILLQYQNGFAWAKLSGYVSNRNNGQTVWGASIKIDGSYLATLTDKTGYFELKKLKEGEYNLSISNIGFETEKLIVSISKDTSIQIKLSPKTILQEEIIVTGTRANSYTPTTFSQIDKQEIEKQNLGQDLPYMLNLQPSVVVTSDAGAGVGYTGIRIRGTDGTRINTTINGIPVNDAESQITYFVDMPDLVSSVDNIQVQRGVGTSANGAGAFGASINIETSKLSVQPYTKISSSAGSFHTFKNTLQMGTGLVKNKYSFDARLSSINSKGYIDRGNSNLLSYYLSGAYYAEKTTLKFISFSGNEKTYQCWNGVPEAKLKGTSEDLLNYIERNGLSQMEAENIIHSNNRTYNAFTYKNQIDNYRQDNYQLHLNKKINADFSFNTALHFTKGNGYYEEFKENQERSNYNLENLIIGNDTISKNDLIRQKWLNNNFYGITYNASYTKIKPLQISLGGAYNIYEGKHYGKIIWSEFSNYEMLNAKYYDDKATKKDFSIYSKANYQLSKSFNLYADMQYRLVEYFFVGFDEKLNLLNQQVNHNFSNPKIGLTYFLSANKTMYASYAIANKEPSRDDYVQSSALSRPKSENLQNIEFGYVQKNKRYTYTFNTYYMKYKNQLVLNGQLNDVGNYNRTNVPESYRLGIEWSNTIKIFKQLELNANATWSTNKIKKYEEFVDNYDLMTQEIKIYENSNISFSPEWIATGVLNYSPCKNLILAWQSKYVGSQFLDNTSNSNRKLNAYLIHDLRLNYSIFGNGFEQFSISIMANNLLNKTYESNGYSYNYITGGNAVTENFYYPQAGINIMGGITLKF